MMYGKEDHIDNKYAFIHVPKTGGALIKKSFNNYLCKDSDINSEHVPSSYFDKHNHNHIFFTMIRDPYDRACSEYFFIKRQLENKVTDVEPWDDEIKRKLKNISLTPINYFLENFVMRNYPSGSIYSYYFDSKKVNDFNLVGHVYEIQKTLNLINVMCNIKIKNTYTNINPNHTPGIEYNFKYSRKDFAKKYSEDYDIYYEGLNYFNLLCKKYRVN